MYIDICRNCKKELLVQEHYKLNAQEQPVQLGLSWDDGLSIQHFHILTQAGILEAPKAVKSSR